MEAVSAAILTCFRRGMLQLPCDSLGYSGRAYLLAFGVIAVKSGLRHGAGDRLAAGGVWRQGSRPYFGALRDWENYRQYLLCHRPLRAADRHRQSDSRLVRKAGASRAVFSCSCRTNHTCAFLGHKVIRLSHGRALCSGPSEAAYVAGAWPMTAKSNPRLLSDTPELNPVPSIPSRTTIMNR